MNISEKLPYETMPLKRNVSLNSLKNEDEKYLVYSTENLRKYSLPFGWRKECHRRSDLHRWDTYLFR